MEILRAKPKWSELLGCMGAGAVLRLTRIQRVNALGF